MDKTLITHAGISAPAHQWEAIGWIVDHEARTVVPGRLRTESCATAELDLAKQQCPEAPLVWLLQEYEVRRTHRSHQRHLAELSLAVRKLASALSDAHNAKESATAIRSMIGRVLNGSARQH